MEGERTVRLGVSPGHRREDDANWAHVQPGAHEHDHHGLHDDLLQVSTMLTIRNTSEGMQATSRKEALVRSAGSCNVLVTTYRSTAPADGDEL